MLLGLPNAETLNTVSQVVVTPPHHKMISLLLHTYNCATVRSCNVKYLICRITACGPQGGRDAQGENHWFSWFLSIL